MNKAVAFAGSAFFAFVATAAPAQEVGDAGAGRALVERVCLGCHGASSRTKGAPTFDKIAAIPSTNARSLGVFLRSSHRAMPNVELTPRERDDIIAYILSLRP